MDIESIKIKIITGGYFYSQHGDAERQNDNLSLLDVEESILNGRILEEYEDTGRGESCLLAGFANSGKPIHAVCGCNGNNLIIVTVYIPTPPKFKNPYERG